MSTFATLIKAWEGSAAGRWTDREFVLHLTMRDAARIAALVAMYPRRIETELIPELLTTALGEREATMPYIPDDRVVSVDEESDPLYEHTSPIPQFLE